MDLIRGARTTLVFINTRAQAELFFQHLWARERRGPADRRCTTARSAARRGPEVEAAMVGGRAARHRRDRVARPRHRLGRRRPRGAGRGAEERQAAGAAHRAGQPPLQRAVAGGARAGEPLRGARVPGGARRGARPRPRRRAARARAARRALPADPARPPAPGRSRPTRSSPRCGRRGPTAACRGRTSTPASRICATGGYALRAYDRWQRLVERGRALAAARPAAGAGDPHERRDHRRHRAPQGAAQGPRRRAARRDRGGLRGDAGAGRHLPLRRRDGALREPARDDGRGDAAAVARSPKIAMYAGTKLATSTLLSHRVVALLADPADWAGLPDYMRDWLALQAEVEPAAAAGAAARRDLSARRACSTSASTASPGATPTRRSGSCVTRRMEAAGLDPIGLRRQRLCAADLGARRGRRPGRAARRRRGCARGSRAGSAANAVMKRTFRNAATVAGLIERNLPGAAQDRAAGDLLVRHPLRHAAQVRPGHLMLRITRDGGGAGARRLRAHRGDAGAEPRAASTHVRGAARHAAGGAAVPRDGAGADQRARPRRGWCTRRRRRCWRGGAGAEAGADRGGARRARDPAAPGLQLFAPTRTGSGRQRSGKRRSRLATFGRSL